METIEQLREEIEKQRRRAEEAEAKVLDGQRQREATEARALAEKHRRENAEKAVARTDFHTFLSLCHNNLKTNLVIQEDPALSSAGTVTNVDSKYYPLRLKPWADFPSLHDQCQRRLESLFKDKNVFPAIAGFDTMNEIFSFDEPLADENDVRLIQFLNVETCAKRVLFQYLKEVKSEPSQTRDDNDNTDADQIAALPLRVYFTNTPYGILLDGPGDSGESQHSDTLPAYQPAMLEAQQKDIEARGRLTDDGPPPAKRMSSPVRKFHPDQWFMRVNGNGSVVPVFVVEYKAAHKLRGSTLKLALSSDSDTDTNAGTRTSDTRDPQGLFSSAIRQHLRNKIDLGSKDRLDAEKATARVIAQAFHYMVEFGLCYSYVASGESMILLYFDAADVRTLYYHLAVPLDEVKSDAVADVRRSAVSMVTTMALLALDQPGLSQRWKKYAVSVLERWPAPYEEIRPQDNNSGEEHTGKLKNRPRLAPRQSQQTCNDDAAQQQNQRGDDDDDENSDREFRPPRSFQASTTPAKKQYATRSTGKSTTKTTETTNTSNMNNATNTNNTISPRRQCEVLPHCNQGCMLGLRNGGALDRACPNVQLHPSTEDGHHTLTPVQLCNRLREQLAHDMDEDCEALDKFGKFGAIGMLFRLTLRSHGYCVAAKGVQRVHAQRLQQEKAIYDHLQEQQGTLVPVCLGIIDLVDVYRTSYGAHVSHMLVMSYAGERLFSKAAGPMPDNINSLVYNVWFRLRQLGVDHGDEHEPNLLWNAQEQQLVCIDFEWAKIVDWEQEKERRREQRRELKRKHAEDDGTGIKKLVA
ncbi:hypothetical protein SPBR_00240 [Sporothrix brasiliensis 5110]|uniref:Protein kinase domain-containing protein n=1 Tax=Sporothrix brasiliensis 5110 TaxID=1398154 RepID=A0A0C2IXS6_9PEZI|nr:uncharacterized protein SPBR_00240 [Sporothrix brasiliensis 5110]KIH89842.1 hypothetical protein SPBR_00240 [Sporothrix brasiliensis 5110]